MMITHEQTWRIPGDVPGAEAVLLGLEQAWASLGYETSLAEGGSGRSWLLKATITIPWGADDDAD